MLFYVFFVLFYVFFVLFCVFFVLFYVFFMLFYVFCVVLCIVCFVSFSVLFVCICVLNYCHRVATQLQLNISYRIQYNRMLNLVSTELGRLFSDFPRSTRQCRNPTMTVTVTT